jgi:hypothetical protein
MYRVRRHRPPSLLDARLIWSPFAGKLAEMGFSYEECRKLNPRLIYASISGYAAFHHVTAGHMSPDC